MTEPEDSSIEGPARSASRGERDLSTPDSETIEIAADELVLGAATADEITAAMEGADSDQELPSVVAVVVSRDPGDHFEATLESLRDQRYANLSVLVIDAGSAKPLADRVAPILPEAFIHRLKGTASFPLAHNLALDLVSEAAFLALCHDDVVLEDNCIGVMVQEVFRSNAAVVAPKVVEWNDPRRLVSIGKGSDKFGVEVDLVEPREFDQDQYDRVRDVFVAPGGLQLIRADLFRELEGFDDALSQPSADVDLCWRVHLLGGRVIAAPDAKIRHLGRHPNEGDEETRRRDLGRGRLRTLLVTASGFSLLRVLPLAIFLLVLEAVYSLIAGRRRQAQSAFGAISWNLSNLGAIRKRRAVVAESRKISDREIHAKQVGGSARVNTFFREQFGFGTDRLAGAFGSVKRSLTGEEAAANRSGAVIGVLLTLFLLFGSRHLITRGSVAVGQVPDLGTASSMLGEWLGGWRSANSGSPGNPASALLAFAIAKVAFFWGSGVLDTALVMAPLFIGALGAWRLVAPFSSLRASAIAAIMYAANPLPMTAMSAGRWDALVVWAVAPSLLASLLRIQGFAPFGRVGGELGPAVADRPVVTRLIRFGLLVSMAATFVPVVGLIAALMALVLVVASIVVARPVGVPRLVVASVVAVIAPAALHFPWTYDLLRQFSWERFVGPNSPESVFDSLADLLRFSTGSLAPSLLTLGVLAAAGCALVIAKDRRFEAAASGWIVALGFWILVWAGRRDLLPFELPTAELMLAPAAAGLALASGMAIRGLEVDFAFSKRISLRQVAALLGVVGVAVASVGGMQRTFDGRWGLPSQSFNNIGGLLADTEVRDGNGTVRMLWLADPSIAPADTIVSPGGSNFFITDGGHPTAADRLTTGPSLLDAQIADRLDLAAVGETIRLGQLLAVYGIDFVVVMEQLAPAPYTGPIISPDVDPGDGVVRVLANQLDLERLQGAPNLVIYRNAASHGPASSQPGAAELTADPRSQLLVDPESGERVSLVAEDATSWIGRGETPEQFRLAVAADGWSVNDPNASVSATPGGLLLVDGVTEPVFEVSHDVPLTRRLAVIGQLLLISIGVGLGRVYRRRA